MKYRRQFVSGLLLLAVSATVASAQITTATIVGTITDPTGAAVANVEVTARNVDTSLTRKAPSNETGAYRLEFLPIGNYVLEVSAQGFKHMTRGGVVLQVNDTVRVDFALKVGEIAETVSVTDAPPPVNTTTAEVGVLTQAAQIDSLPLVERNVYALLDLTPGVQSNSGGTATAPSGSNPLVLGYPEQRTFINGGVDGGTGSVNYYLDGGVNMTGLRNTGNILPNPDAIEEFRVITNSYNAEYGRFASGVINVITKSGTNAFHGAVFEYLRNTVFNANDWGSQLDRAPFHRNQFGASLGGPVAQGKTFFFASYSGLRQATSTFLNNAIVPTPLERTGDFSKSGTKPTDPATGQAFACNGVAGVICPNRLDPVAMKIINSFIPLANVPGNIWQGYIGSPYNSDDALVKMTHVLNGAHTLNGSYFETGGTNTVRSGTGNLPWAYQQFNWRQHNLNVSDVWIINPSMINQVWLTFTRNYGGRLNLPQTSLGDLGSAFTIQGTPSLPQITVSGFFTLTNAIGGPKAGGNFYSLRDVFSLNKGRHALKFGGEASLEKDIQDTLLNNYGVFTFNNSVTKNALADFEIGIPSAITQDAPVTAYYNSWYSAFFLQDDYRIHPRLTLNLGLRWDIQTPITDPYNRAVTYVPGVKSKVNPAAPTGQLFYGDPGVERGVIPVRWHHLSPRVGLAWDPFGNGKTSIRAAGGVFFGSISGNEWGNMTNYQPFATRLTFTNTSAKTAADGTPAGASLRNPYNAFVGGNPFPYKGTFVNGGGIFGISQNFQWPYSYQFNFSIQRQVMRDMVVTAGYVGSLFHNLPFARDANYPVLTPTATNAGASVLARRPNPAFGAVLQIYSDQTASYHGLQITANKRMSHHLMFNSFYTFSKTLNSVELQNNTVTGGAQNYAAISEDKGPADTDQRHVFGLGASYLPDYYTGGNRIMRNVLNGWSIAPFVKLRSGLPFSITNGNVDANLDGNTNDRARLIGDPHIDNPTPAMWFNTAAFVQNKAVTGVAVDGNAGRNLLYGPGYHVVDLAISRDFRINERFKLRFRAESTNALNMVSYGQPGNAVPSGATSSTFGVIRSAQSMRKLQMGLKLSF